MQFLAQIVLSLFAVFGMYAILCRVLLLLLPTDRLVSALRLRGDEGEEKASALLSAARLAAEEKQNQTSRTVVLLSDLSDESTMRFLIRENVELYLRISEKGAPYD